MLRERIRTYCQAGENCSRIILQAAAEEYDISLSQDILTSCSGISGGFGIGSLCGGMIAAVMVLSLLFDEETVKEKRILFFFLVQEKLGVLDCMRLSADDCSEILEMIGEVLQEVIEKK